MPARSRIEQCFTKPVIPVIWDASSQSELISHASAVILQGGSVAGLPKVLNEFEQAPLERMELLVHIDLVSGLENNDAGLEYLAQLRRVRGVVTVHAQLAKSARRLGLLSIVRLFLSDTRAVARGLSVAARSQPDAIEILPAAAAAKVEDDFRQCLLPRIAGGLCRTVDDIREALASGCQAVTSTRSSLWQLNDNFADAQPRA